ncbi:conserved hypothetical protein [Thermobifida fusca YX]|nr:conserved hypothetical protein [Thermobifida fusca YX]
MFSRPRPSSAYPHVRGAHRALLDYTDGEPGPSPRAWGSLGAPVAAGQCRRSIPTCVGLTEIADELRKRITGPSPRAWGSPPSAWTQVSSTRSIPTCVGLTEGSPRCYCENAVHPHVRGAHLGREASWMLSSGPSPRAWGSPPRFSGIPTTGRSIPTCVGLTEGVSDIP